MVSTTSTLSATTTITEVTTLILTETPTISTTSESKASTTEEPVATIEELPYQGTYHEKVLYSHNIHRGNHSAPNLNWDQRLSNAAHDWAIQCQFHHNTGMLPGRYDQNLAGSSPNASMSQHISDYWYNGEMRNFDSHYGQSNPGEDFGGYGHFTQLVWKDTRSVGCATIDCRGSSLGNYLGLFDRNVMKPIGWETVRGSATDLIDRNSW
ncbi:hypothetical protein N7520_009751 [Penicillium odoratum]|uniref:uncharacterized protein n=1 Tax=Penicillium odoratum TaxID=1167516 RepID=UPI0025496D48|nr:uncharacterized protein N7520_009751 [Penicillium odoratum]KAJ5752834.1 hypothetical protein N7520_009751 [Penicillium odoratum]